jgi:uncharacterized protein
MDAVTALLPLVALAAFSYAFVGHAGASAYLSLSLVAGLVPAEAKGQALVMNLAVGAFSAYFFTQATALRWRLLAWLLAGSIPMAFVGGGIIPALPVFRTLVALALAAAAVRLAMPAASIPPALASEPPRRRLLLLGAGLGLLSGLTGVGGGIYLSPILLLTGWAGPLEVAGLAAWFILVNSIAGLGGYLGSHSFPQVEPSWLLVAALAGAFGAWQGSRVRSVWQRRALAGVVGAAALKFML